MTDRLKNSHSNGRTCYRCKQKFQALPGATGEKACPACRATPIRRRSAQPPADHGAAQPPQPSDDYPGTEWAPLPSDLLIRISAHVLAREYVAWAAQRRA